ncbi:Hypothetical predicted protein [Pelobates cultripes]|uniref:Uncharacterized protein n=1 Tax=Pelobates cultripes TaxID=61616 RepID=A0AAD1RGC7_PELCU|nr:Hypothetical predicted protein [Pelobates cultripes]
MMQELDTDLLGYFPLQRNLDWIAENNLTADRPSTIGRRSQKPPPGTPSESQDIGALMQRQALPKMAIPENQEASAYSQTHTPDCPQAHNLPQAPEQTAAGFPYISALATKQDIKNLLNEFCQTLAMDISVIQADLQVVTDRVRATEEYIIDVRWEVTNVKDSLQNVQKTQQAFSTHLATLKDHSRRNNLKIT